MNKLMIQTILILIWTTSIGWAENDYFNPKPGSKWTYIIEAKTAVIAGYYEVLTDNFGSLSASPMHFSIQNNKLNLQHNLTMNVINPDLTKFKPFLPLSKLNFSIIAELIIEQDSLGLFESFERVFIASTINQMNMYSLVCTIKHTRGKIPSGESPHPNDLALGINDKDIDYYVIRPLFFILRRGGRLNSPTRSDHLTYHGIETKNPQLRSAMKFVREVVGANSDEKERIMKYSWIYDNSASLAKGFKEYYWFAKGKGLVKVTQVCDGQETMTWTLKESQ